MIVTVGGLAGLKPEPPLATTAAPAVAVARTPRAGGGAAIVAVTVPL